jgi:phosphatidate cytidylyltransferase
MAMNWPGFFTRLGSAIVYAGVMVYTLLSPTMYLVFPIMFVSLWALKEFYNLSNKITQVDNDKQEWRLLFMAALTSWIWVLILTYFDFLHWALPLSITICFFILLYNFIIRGKSMLRTNQLVIGFLYTIVSLHCFILLRDISLVLSLACLLMIWMNDTMAYIVGSFIGKTPLTKISPKKTWEGTIGGALFTIVGAAIFGYYSDYYSIQNWMVIAAIVVVMGTLGDLFESRFKRLAGVKDSGRLMPGHGGALDRFDSLIMVAPFVYLYAKIALYNLDIVVL